MKYKTDNPVEVKRVQFFDLSRGDVFRLGSTLYIKTDEVAVDDEYDDDSHYFNAINLKYGEHKYIDGYDTVEYYRGEIIFKEDEFQSSWT